ncbi:MAG TPA: hypothetical protein PL078_09880 [Bacillota bacterium]|nr:hypothetical protein [Peptococcaceae bacterium MAG4]NLW39076.1 hypothetical protein [Peptococcaceae bacterium]HPZ44296.1 hypothetical protein [Bacillota bacterium]HQD77055.1 hypothetical protein [Bacillota bacterium]HUM59600.1 hypothetical protein [Bacillota bacterium]
MANEHHLAIICCFTLQEQDQKLKRYLRVVKDAGQQPINQLREPQVDLDGLSIGEPGLSGTKESMDP